MRRMTRLFGAIAFVCLTSAAFATVTVSGNVEDLSTSAVSSRVKVRFTVRGCGGNQPRVTGTAQLVPSFYEFTPTAGAISGTVVDSLTEISCGGSVGATWYGVTIYYDGKPGPEVPYNVTGASFNLNSATPNTTSPVVSAPTGDSTYGRLDGGNMPFTGNVQAPNVYTSTSPYINVKWYGAIGDGSTDDTTASQNAITAASAVKGCVYFPAGTYKITTVLTGTSTLYCLIGDGVGQSILKVTNSASTNAIFASTSTPDGFKIKGLQFDGPGATASGGQIGVTVGKSGGNVSDAIFEDLFFKDWPNYALELDAAIVTSVRNVRVLTSKKGIFYNGGTSITTSACYMNSITRVGYDVKGVGYSSFISNAADTVGLAYLIRNASQAINLIGNGHEIGTARNVTVTNVALTANVATVTYTGDDLSADWVSGMTIVVASTTSTAGAFNGRQVPTSVTSSTIVYPLTHADVVSASDSGTASLFAGDGIVINNSTGTQVNGFYGLAAQQLTSHHVTVSGNSANTILTGIVSAVGTSGTPVTQTIDIYIGASAGNVFRFNTNLVGGVSGLSSQIQTYSSNLWTLGGIADNTGTPATAGFLRLSKTDAINFRNNANGADVNGITLDGSDVVQVGGTAGFKAGASGSAIADSRELIQSAHLCGTTTTCANTANGSYREILGSVALSSASPSTATITGISPAFTSTSTYFCTATPEGATAAIAAGGIAVSKVSGSSFTLTGPNTVTTVIHYRCTGN